MFNVFQNGDDIYRGESSLTDFVKELPFPIKEVA